jgi:hypothetical protein
MNEKSIIEGDGKKKINVKARRSKKEGKIKCGPIVR